MEEGNEGGRTGPPTNGATGLVYAPVETDIQNGKKKQAKKDKKKKNVKSLGEAQYEYMQECPDLEDHLEAYPTLGDSYPKMRGAIRYKPACKHFIPIRKGRKNIKSHPIDHAGLFSFVTFSWIGNVMWKAFKHPLTTDDLWDQSPIDSCRATTYRLAYLWKQEVSTKGLDGASFAKVSWRFIRTRMCMSWFLMIFFLTFSFIGPTIFIRNLVIFCEQPSIPLSTGIALVIGLFVSELGRSISFATVFAINYRTAVRLRSATLGLIFQKLLSLRGLQNKAVGEIINLFANDAQRIFDVVIFGPLIVSGPITMIVGVAYTVWLIGEWALIGMVCFILFYPLQFLLAKLIATFRREGIKVTDQRVRLMNEVLHCVKLIKMYAWEDSFAKHISEVRQKEKGYLEKIAYIQSLSISLTPIVPILAAIITFLAHTGTGHDLTPSQAFTVMAVLILSRMTLAILPFAIKSLADFVVTARRCKSILVMEEMSDAWLEPDDKSLALLIRDATLAHENFSKKAENGEDESKKVGKEGKGKKGLNKKSKVVKNGTAAFHKGDADDVKEEESEQLQGSVDSGVETTEETRSHVEALYDINLSIKKGSLVGICGTVGSGKSSFIASLLGKMKLLSGSIQMKGTLAYVSQQPWILNATVKDNILFGTDFDAERYQEAIYTCHLNQDIAMLGNGDETEIGERGVNLSGGQKMRVSLARALYSGRDIYLLDDPLSCVDAHVGQHIFNQYIKSSLSGRTIIFITHQLQYLKDCDDILVLKEGRISERGSHGELMSHGGEYATLVTTYLEDERDKKKKTSDEELNVDNDEVDERIEGDEEKRKDDDDDEGKGEYDGKLVVEEEKALGAVALSTYADYLRAAGGFPIGIIVMLAFIVNVSCITFSNWWLSYWLKQGAGGHVVANSTSNSINLNPKKSQYELIYGLSILAMLITGAIKGFIFMKTSLFASSNIHDHVFRKVFQATMTFFDTTPTGRILNRFSRDLDEVDQRIPFIAETFLGNIWVVMASLVVIAAIFPYMLAAIFPLGIFFYLISRCFRCGVRELKRLENVTRSPVYSHITATVHGLDVIRAYDKRKEFVTRFNELWDVNSVSFYMFQSAMRWMALRLDVLTITCATITAALVVTLRGEVSAAYAGLALTYAIQLSGLFQFTVRMLSETEARFTSVERLQHYAKNLPLEPAHIIPDSRPTRNWPKDGRIIFNDVCLRYRDNLPLVLKNVTFTVQSREKIGVVGRTGAGKSSLGVALFRLVELDSGVINIDNINISELGLHDLRSRLSIVPQDPTLFVGTVRYNLDPFNQYTDSDIWSALARTHMKDVIKNLDGDLSATVVENGENFSVGERQLICMARALLRHSKIIMLDEATAGIDTETDALIQQTIRDVFKETTMITIAHRLNTVLTYDKILVMDGGKAVEFDRPADLLANKSSMFSSLMAASEAQGLLGTARLFNNPSSNTPYQGVREDDL